MPRYIKTAALAGQQEEADAKVRSTVETIIADVAKRGDAAVRELSERFDKWSPPRFRLRATLLHGSAAEQSQPRAPTVYGRRTYSGRPSSSMRFSEAIAMATSVVCRRLVRERSASSITRL